MKLAIAPLVACVLVVALSSTTRATIPLPVSWYTFDNEDEQDFGTFDGVVKDQGPRGIDFGVNQNNGAGGTPFTYFVSEIDDAESDPAGSGIAPEHYIDSDARFSGAGSAYHMLGATASIYDDGTGMWDFDEVDPQTQDVIYSVPYDFSWRDVLEPEPDETAGGNFGGDHVTYSFWMAMPSLAQGNDQRRAHLISQESAENDAWGGDVQVVYGPLNGFSHFRFRNDAIVVTEDVKFKINDWHHYVVEYDMTGEEGVVTVWQDGGLLNTTPVGDDTPQKEVLGGLGTDPVGGLFRLNQSAHPEGIGYQFSGDFYFDDFAIWTGVGLTDQHVYELFSQGITASLPGYSSADTDTDYDVDTADLTKMFQNFTGDVGGAGGKTMAQGDTDADGDVDTADITAGFQQFTGSLFDGLANNPDLVYDPSTGNVKIYADGATVGSFNLQSAGQFNPPADFSDLDADVFPFPASVATDNTVNTIGWVSSGALAGFGFDGPAGTVNTPFADLGNILPTGLDLAGLEALLTANDWAVPLNGGTPPSTSFDLVVVPEPGSLVLLVLGALGLFCVRLKREVAS